MKQERIDWPDGAKIALSIVMNVEEGSEMTVACGDRGMKPVDELGLENHPDVAAAIRDLGHEPVSHGYRWVHQFKMDEAAERDFIRKAVHSIETTTGTRPYGWLSRYFHTDNTRRLLIEEALPITWTIVRAIFPFGIARPCRANRSPLCPISLTIMT